MYGKYPYPSNRIFIVALESSRLPGPFHGDPADRIMVATARRMGARLMTRDRKLIQYARKGHLAIL